MALLVLLLLGFLVTIIVMPFVAMAKAGSAQRLAEDLKQRMDALEREIYSLRQTRTREAGPEPAPIPARQPVEPMATVEAPPKVQAFPPRPAVTPMATAKLERVQTPSDEVLSSPPPPP